MYEFAHLFMHDAFTFVVTSMFGCFAIGFAYWLWRELKG